MKRLETVKAWGHEHGRAKRLTRVAAYHRGKEARYFNVRVRIIREADYRKLVKMANNESPSA